MDLEPTPSQTVGPFFHFCLTNEKSCIRSIAGPQVRGERVLLTVRVLDGNGEAVPDAMIEIWQANSEGKYNHPDDAQQKTVDTSFLGFGRMATAENGACEFETIRPGRVPGPGNIAQAPHLNLAVFARGMLKQLYTRIYFAGDPANQEDPVLALAPVDRQDTLMARPDAARPGGWRFDMRLQGEGETVFFDV
jgi:protocatechuate 3,4-dioxygenase, alpha subunit